jgi:hypothetical protein
VWYALRGEANKFMVVASCHLCDKKPEDAELYGASGFTQGEVCPVCFRPTCRHHMGMVRWRWKNDLRAVGSALVCMECKSAYKHRNWDPIHREWIS